MTRPKKLVQNWKAVTTKIRTGPPCIKINYLKLIKMTTSSPETQDKRRRKNSTDDEEEDLQIILPKKFRKYVVHYHDDFFISPFFDANLIKGLMYEGFLPIATCDSYDKKYYLLPKIHSQRCVLYFENIHISKSSRRKSRDYILKVNQDFDAVVSGCHQKHGIPWLYPPMVDALKKMFYSRIKSKVNLYSIELYKKNSTGQLELQAGELGYTVGKIYTSLTGFYFESGSGTIQLLALAGLLKMKKFRLWDFGMEMEYKTNLGAITLERKSFLSEFRKLRDDDDSSSENNHVTSLLAHSDNNSSSEGFDAKMLIDQIKIS